MADLQCAARVFVARHGEARYESELVSDSGGWLSPLGRQQARALADRLAGERVAAVWSSPMARAVQTAEVAAAVLGVDVVVREGLREFGVGDHAGGTGDPDPFRDTFGAWLAGDLDARVPGAESGAEVVARVAAVCRRSPTPIAARPSWWSATAGPSAPPSRRWHATSIPLTPSTCRSATATSWPWRATPTAGCAARGPGSPAGMRGKPCLTLG